jgi:GNAT superfamily N-acetyltransferase
VSTGIAVRSLDAYELAGYAGQLAALHRQCFAAPPWHEPEDRLAGFPARLAAHLDNSGAGGIVVTDGSDGSDVLGVVYGWPAGETLATGSPFDDALAAAVSPDVASRLVAPALVVAELMVAPRHQRRGIGRALLARYVEDFPAAWLVTHPAAPAAKLYEREGWRQETGFVVADHPLVVFTWQATTRTAQGARRPAPW